ncbi:MAG TPA: ABC transporter ATP-binding protein [Chitinophagales bacterium]|nr:ABC transporter ATP-binding protein [Chitinophagales bacterium]HRP38529.1 ABC transporter ATP-binding protein [Chitinophagales bacterium]
MKQFIRLLRYLIPYRSNVLLNVVFNLLSVVFSLVSIVMLIPFLQLLFGKTPLINEAPTFAFSPNFAISFFEFKLSTIIKESGTTQGLLFICIITAIIFFLKNLFRFLAVYVMSPVRNGVVRDIRNDLYKKILSLPLAYYSKEKKGDLIARMTDDVKEIETSIMNVLEIFFREPVNIIVFLGAMVMMSFQLTIFVFVMLLITGGIIGRIGKKLKRTSAEGQEKLGFLISIIDETLSGLRIIHAFNAGKFKTVQFKEINSSHFKIANRLTLRRELSSPLTEFLAICVVCTVLWFGGRLVLDKQLLSAETFIGFMVIFSQLIPPAKSFSNAFYNIQKGLASSHRIYEILDAENSIKETPNPISVKDFHHSIELKNVSFAYNNFDQKEILSQVNLKIEKGKMIALVGQSGAGKSTMVDLLPRFYDPQKGEVLIDGENIKNLNLHSLRDLFGIVSQEAILFNDTVYNNIAFGFPGANKEAVEEAAKIANAHDFIMRLENGYETNIGDRGSKLSGGEKQRLTIARAVLKNPPILILDEATSSLDSNSEKLVQEALNKLMKGRTSIVIAHRLSTIQFADEIIVMKNGAIAERGNHIGLMAHNGIYKQLVELQAF